MKFLILSLLSGLASAKLSLEAQQQLKNLQQMQSQSQVKAPKARPADGHPPKLPLQYTATMGTAAAPKQVYNDASAKKYATFESSGLFTVADCVAKMSYTNAPAIPIPGQIGTCKYTPPSPYYDATCPSVYAPAWPPAAADFYSGYRAKTTYQQTMDCPTLSGARCDRYFFDMYDDGYETFEFFINAETQVPVSGTIKVAKAIYQHTLTAGVDQSKLGRPPNCPDPDAPGCAICFSGACGPCQACVGQAKSGQCAACWKPDEASGFSCMADDASKDLCTECWKPAAPTPQPAPTPSGPADTCGGSCSNLGITGQCCPTAKGDWLDCCNHQASCDANPSCAAQGIDGDCCPTKTGANLDCCFSPSPSAPTPAADACDICDKGECAACKACVSSQAGPCAPCWEVTDRGSCLPSCNDNCWHTGSALDKTPSQLFAAEFR